MPLDATFAKMKQIRTIQDLAINGASPAFAHPLHVGRPNIGRREAFLSYADGIFDLRWLSNNEPLVQEFEQRVADHHQVKHCEAICNGEPSRWKSRSAPWA